MAIETDLARSADALQRIADSLEKLVVTSYDNNQAKEETTPRPTPSVAEYLQPGYVPSGPWYAAPTTNGQIFHATLDLTKYLNFTCGANHLGEPDASRLVPIAGVPAASECQQLPCQRVYEKERERAAAREHLLDPLHSVTV